MSFSALSLIFRTQSHAVLTIIIYHQKSPNLTDNHPITPHQGLVSVIITEIQMSKKSSKIEAKQHNES